MKIEELDLTPVIVRHLHGAGITSVAQLTVLRRSQVRELHGMGEKVTERLEVALAKIGKHLKR